jgi:hypothetical protein
MSHLIHHRLIKKLSKLTPYAGEDKDKQLYGILLTKPESEIIQFDILDSDESDKSLIYKSLCN